MDNPPESLSTLSRQIEVRIMHSGCKIMLILSQKLQNEYPHATCKEAALELALSAVELSIKALKLAKDPFAKSSMNFTVKTLLEDAERIKHDPSWTPQPSSSADARLRQETHNVSKVKKLIEPKSTRSLTKKEEILLLKASFLNGFKFPPWKKPPSASEFELGEDGCLFL